MQGHCFQTEEHSVLFIKLPASLPITNCTMHPTAEPLHIVFHSTLA